MILLPKVKEFIEFYIEDIEKENTKFLFEESLGILDDVEFKQLYSIFQDLPFEYDLDQFIEEIISEICSEIIEHNRGKYICIEAEWTDYAAHWFGDKERIIEQFDDFECDIINMKHWCFIYEY